MRQTKRPNSGNVERQPVTARFVLFLPLQNGTMPTKQAGRRRLFGLYLP